ncbi:DNA mismatch repair endonuclease MutL [Salinibaculum rarum]|uniref:DNA mismatch repair endonuclease MutL n=1 Tax=Salinibaculum rarum TaxID=3058903 RepID=UPI002660503E|nr:DNA mismatch repair endonuclease MutL [Salinibaculum sp. KK48]
MADIRELDPQTVERIAAGEVVERPSSVVKELVENSLDAGANRVEVAVQSGGIDGIRVTDDGAGMTDEEVRQAVEKHTTSKITDIADLEGGVGTLGFRGEALHAIGAVSRLTITTRPREDRVDGSVDSGTELVVEGGEVTSVASAGCPTGTTIEIRDLFYNVPARRKYLKQASTEFAHVNTVVTSYALANPDVAVSLSHDGRETFATTGRGDRRETVMAVYGREVAQSMLPVDDASMPDGPLDGVSGLVSHPETNRASREYLSTFVNGRYVTASTVRNAVVEGYGAQLASDRFPFAVLDLAVDPADVDVNVHPRKLEVRFADDEQVREQVTTAVEQTLLEEGLIRSSAPRGRSAPEQTEIRPGDGTDTSGDSTAGEADSEPTDDATPETESEQTETRPDTTMSPTHTESPASPLSASARESIESTDSTDSHQDPDRESTDETEDGGVADTTGASETETSGRGHPGDDSDRKFAASHDQQRLDGDSLADRRDFDTLPAMRVLGQFHDTYVVAETDDGLVLVDQHAADERINYERLRADFDGETTTQALATPVELELTAKEMAVFERHGDALARLGFRADRVDEHTVAVSTVPSLVADVASPDLLRDLLGDLVTGEAAAAETVDAAADELLADLACYPSITGNTSLTEGSVVDLLEALDDCTNPYACPHGRPVVVELDTDELEARFERDYPGHGG